MIFHKLIIKNFRQFKDEQILKFATAPDQNVTVIHGFNGSGKTTLLNVFTWLFYGEFTPDFENPDFLETEAAFAQLQPQQDLETFAKLSFKDKGRQYEVSRKIVVSKDSDGKRLIKDPERLTLSYTDEAGELREPGNPQDFLEQLLPKPLYPFFFFNGERIEKLASRNAGQEIESSVKVLLDIEVFDRSIHHLNGEISRRLRDEIAQHSGEDGQKARERQTQLEQKKTQVEESLQQLKKNLIALQDEKERIDIKLRAMPELATLQAEREAKEQELKQQQELLKNCRKRLREELSHNGYLAFVSDVLIKAKEILDAAHQKGELPIPIKRQFVDELLEKKECICGRTLNSGDISYQCVEQWRNRAGSEELESAVSVTKAKLTSLSNRREKILYDISNLQRERESIQQHIRWIQEQLSELSSRIGNREQGENYERLETRRNDIESDITEIKVGIAKQEIELHKLIEELRQKDQEIKKLEKVDERGKLAQRRLEAVLKVASAIEELRQLRHQQLSGDLSRRLGEVWSGISIKDYQAKLDEHYHLCLTKTVNGSEIPVNGASTGEKQVLSLAFIGSLVDKARSTYDNKADSTKAILFKGGLYSLVIDSAFGQLEKEYKRDVAQWMPTLAPQVIILVSKTQWEKEVEDALRSRIGSQWILKCSTPKKRESNIILRGHEYPYVVHSLDNFETTELIEVKL